MAIIMSGVSSSDIEHGHRVARAWGRPLADRAGGSDVKSDIVIRTKPESTSESQPTKEEEEAK